MVKPQEEFPSASAHIQQTHPWTEEFLHTLAVVPGKGRHRVAALQVGKVPAFHAPALFFPPLAEKLFPVHVFLSTWWKFFKFPCF